MRLIKASAECPHCPVKKHQIDGTEERALQVVRDAIDKHVKEAHPDQPTPRCGRLDDHAAHEWTTPPLGVAWPRTPSRCADCCDDCGTGVVDTALCDGCVRDRDERAAEQNAEYWS